jgi:hypothetical protein
MAKIRMKTTAAGPGGTFQEGKEYPLNKKTERYIKAGYAEYTEKPEEKMHSKIETSESEKDIKNIFPKATGGGWYELSNGEKKQGRENAIEAEKKLGESNG